MSRSCGFPGGIAAASIACCRDAAQDTGSGARRGGGAASGSIGRHGAAWGGIGQHGAARREPRSPEVAEWRSVDASELQVGQDRSDGKACRLKPVLQTRHAFSFASSRLRVRKAAGTHHFAAAGTHHFGDGGGDGEEAAGTHHFAMAGTHHFVSGGGAALSLAGCGL
ncbi:MAG: hypothetical protein ACKO3T_23800 [Planctomycetaceae bacterium]